MPALVGIGISQDLRFELPEHAVLGRGNAATIVLADPLVSARHAELSCDAGGRYRIVDLGATHGTFVNGVQVAETLVVDGDEIIVGATRLRFEDREPRPVDPAVVSVADNGHVVRHRLPAARPGFPRAAEIDLPEGARRDYERLRIAFEIGQVLAAHHDLDDLLRVILDRAFELVPAERGAILLREPNSETLTPRVALRRDGGDDGVVLPRCILDEVVAQRVGLVSSDASLDTRFGRAASVVSQGVRAALSVPMVHDKDLVGVIYLDASSAGVFGERDLDVLATVAGQAALALRTARLRTSLEHQERMAVVAQVSGGIAHDFANLLTMVLSCADMIGRDASVPEPQRVNARRIESAATQAARLTRKLGTLARGGPADLRTLELGAFVTDAAELLRRTLGQRVELVLETPAHGCRVIADPVELEQILLNLAFNARDAMEGQGRLTIDVRRELVDGREHAALSVSDTGSGMPSNVTARVFEPFFTTKPPGRGTGMGLSVVHRLVTEARGRIDVSSEPGHGATFTIHWPLTSTVSDATASRSLERANGEMVLVVDDDDAVREVMVSMLDRAGFTVLHAATGDEAIAATAGRTGLRVLVVDVVLGAMTGRQLAERVRAEHPELRVLYVSGYTEASEAEELTALGATFLSKPFAEHELVARIQAALRDDVPEPSRRRLELVARFADGAAFLASYDDVTNSLEIPGKLDEGDRAVALMIRFDDAGREFRIHGRIGAPIATTTNLSIVFDPEEAPARDLVLACARGDSIPYFRRVEPRIPARLAVRLTTEAGLAIASHSQDISARGLMVSSDHRLEIGTQVALRIVFPGAEPLTMVGRVRSCIRNGPRRGLGLEFAFSSQEQRDALATCVASLPGA